MIGEQSEKKFLKRLKTKFSRLPFSATLEITSRCNFRCLHCVQLEEIKKNHAELSLKEIYSIIDKLKKLECLRLNLSGGEPFLRKDFSKIYKYAVKSGFLVSIFTNGSVMQEKHIRLFKEFPPYGIRVSLYGGSESSYQEMVGRKGEFKKVISNISKLKENGINFKILAQISEINKSEAEGMKKIADNFEANFSFNAVYAPKSNGDLSPTELSLSPREEEKINRKLNLKESPVLLEDRFKNCRTTRDCIMINYKGKLITCPFGLMREKGYDVLGKGVKEVWQDCKGISLPDKCRYNYFRRYSFSEYENGQ